jgi:5-methylcytosine-specific restriction endonuclease McrA
LHKYSKDYYLKTREQTIEKRRIFRRTHKEQINLQQKQWYKNNKEKRELIKREVLTHYGNGKLACVKCGFDDLRALTLDHIVPVGDNKHRVTGMMFYPKLLKLGFPEGYQTLCANCQMIKMFEGDEWHISH